MRSIAVLSSSALLFLIEPLIAQRLLPEFGGAPSVWLGATLAFQALLLAATALSNQLAKGPSSRARSTLIALGILSCLSLGLQATLGSGLLAWSSGEGGPPLAQVVAAVSIMGGLPFFTLGVAGPLLQRGRHGAFGRYALSSAGSIAGLLIGPLLLSRALDLGAQSALWAAGFVGVALLIPWCIDSSDGTRVPEEPRSPIGPWVALAALGAALQLAITRQVTEDVAPVPLLWVIPLALYLGSYVVAFAAPAWASPERAGPILALGVLGVVEVLAGRPAPLWMQAMAYALALWGGCLLCHGQLHRLRPPGEQLPRFSLAVQLGGVLGSAAVSLVAPLVFRGATELPLCLVLLLCLLARRGRRGAVAGMLGAAAGVDLGLRVREALASTSLAPTWATALASAAALATLTTALAVPRGPALAALLLGGTLSWDHAQSLRGSVAQRRSFFGVVRVEEWEGLGPSLARRMLVSGAIVHGVEWMDPERESEPTAYFRPASAIGQVLGHRPPGSQGWSVGVLGLGAGTLAAYAEPGDRFRFYELNPDMAWAARDEFHFLERARGEVSVVLGDGRRSLEREAPQGFDVLVLDAFSGDSIPVHLLTREAFSLYLRHLAPGGIIAAQVTNRYVDVGRVLARMATTLDLEAREQETAADGPLELSCRWVVLSRRSDLAGLLPQSHPLPSDGRSPWTDSRVDLLDILR